MHVQNRLRVVNSWTYTIEYLIKNEHSFCRLVGRRSIQLNIFNAIRYAHSTTIIIYIHECVKWRRNKNNPPATIRFVIILPARIFDNSCDFVSLTIRVYGWMKQVFFFCEPFFRRFGLIEMEIFFCLLFLCINIEIYCLVT